MPSFRILFLLTAILCAAGAEAAIYKCVDAEGRVTFTDARCRGGKRVDLPGGATSVAPRPGGVSAPRAASPAGFPRIDAETQKRRDDIRQQVLRDEIASERRGVVEAKRQFELGRKLLPGERAGDSGYQERVKRLSEDVARHEQNVTAIQRELNSLR